MRKWLTDPHVTIHTVSSLLGASYETIWMVSTWCAKNGNLKRMVNEMGLFTCILWKFLYYGNSNIKVMMKKIWLYIVSLREKQ